MQKIPQFINNSLSHFYFIELLRTNTKKKKKNVGYTNLYIVVEEMNNSVSIYTNCSSIS